MTYSCAIFPDLDADLLDDRPNIPLRRSVTAKVDVSGSPEKASHAPTFVFGSGDVLSSPSHPALAVTSVGIKLADHSTAYTHAPCTEVSEPATLRALASNDRVTNVNVTPTLVDSRASPNKDFEIGINGDNGSEWPEMDDLYIAQIRKLDHIIKKGDIRPGHRVSGVFNTSPFRVFLSQFSKLTKKI